MHKWLKSKYDLNDPELISVIDDLPLWSAPFGLKLLDMVKFESNMNVLDIGSGAGFPVIDLSQRLGNTCRVYAVEPWQAAAERICHKINKWGIRNLEIVKSPAESLSFPENYFNLITSNNGINNVEKDHIVMEEINRVSAPGAQLVFTMNLPQTMIEFYDIFKDILNDYGKKQEIKKLEEHIFAKRKPLSYVENLLKANNFEIKRIYEDEFYMRYADGTAMLNHFIIKLSFLESWTAILKPQDINPIFALLEKNLNDIALEKGELKLTVPWICFDCKKVTGIY